MTTSLTASRSWSTVPLYEVSRLMSKGSTGEVSNPAPPNSGNVASAASG
jgi:hypothetical protein